MLTTFVDEPSQVTSRQMNRWARDFDNWGICDTVCFHLFDRTPHAWGKVERWSRSRHEFVKRAAFALLAGLALHDKRAGNDPFLLALELAPEAVEDERKYVQKGVSWGVRVVGRRNQALNTAAVEISRKMADSPHSGARSVGKEALRELTSPLVRRVLARRG